MAGKSNPTRVVLVIVLALVAVSGASLLLRPHELIDWRTDYAAARLEAEKSHKFLIVYLTASWCGPCQQMRRTTWTDQTVANVMNDFVPVKVDVDQHNDLWNQLRIGQGVPEFVMMTPDGQTVMGAEGYMEPDQFVKWIKGKPVAAMR